IDCDFYAITGHKIYGPSGIGALYGKAEHLEAMPPFQGGGEMIESVTMDAVSYNDPPYRFEAGTPPIAEAAALTAALDYVESIGKDRIRAHEDGLRRYAEERLKRIDSVKIIGQAPGKGPIVSFTMEGAHAHDAATILDRSGIAVRAGSHCAEPLLARFGLTATCRASFGLYNTRAEVDALAEALLKAERFFK
ncbi:MAG: aminotransferase class V-fold PLP-dependent enzyme, partial [Rhodomicrobium sp.]